jgi:hypothetical protein
VTARRIRPDQFEMRVMRDVSASKALFCREQRVTTPLVGLGMALAAHG